MNVLNLFRRRAPASVARERLQILLAHERSSGAQPELLAVLREEILAAITKHVSVDHDSLVIRMDRRATVSTLEIEVELPNEASRLKAAG